MGYVSQSNIKGNDGKEAAPGDDVSAESLGLTEEEFSELIESGAVKETDAPAPAASEGTEGNEPPTGSGG